MALLPEWHQTRQNGRETRTNLGAAQSHNHTPIANVRLTDTRPVYCSGCAVLLPRLEGPLPCPAYCYLCVQAGACP